MQNENDVFLSAATNFIPLATDGSMILGAASCVQLQQRAIVQNI